MYMDQRGKFLVVSSQENQYIMVMYTTDRNLILVKAMKTKTSREMYRAYHKIMQHLKDRGIPLKKHILDNEASDKFLRAIRQNGIKYEKVPPNIH